MTKKDEIDVKHMIERILYDLAAAIANNCKNKSKDYSSGYVSGVMEGSNITITEITAFMQKIVEENTPKDEDTGDDYSKIIKELASRMN